MTAPTPEATSLAPFPAPAPDQGVVLSVQGVSKSYKLWTSPTERLRYSILSQAHRTLRSVWPQEAAPLVALRRRRDALHQDFTALHELSFEVRRGESLGIIGRNGAGKSTLLQIVAGTLRPSTGHVEVRGRVAALLELGSGFNLEFTGRENVYLNASILGFSEAEIDAKFDSIAGFADIGDFLEQPVKTYSSGMMVRLAFAVQMAVEPAVFIIDEALAVGDIYFQSKCNKILRKKLDDGLTLLLVSHNPGAVRMLCSRGLVLDRGRNAFLGPSDQAVNVYHELGESRVARGAKFNDESVVTETIEEKEAAMTLPPLGRIQDEIGSREIVVNGCGLFDDRGAACRDFALGETIHAGFSLRSEIAAEGVLAGFVIRDRYNNTVTALTTANQGLEGLAVKAGETYTIFLSVPGRLGVGEYLLDFGVGARPDGAGSPECHYHRVGGIASFSVLRPPSVVTFQGICNLGSEFHGFARK